MKKILLTLITLSLTLSAENPKTLVKKCTSCHGMSFEKSAMGKSAIVKGQKAETIEKSLTEYKSGTKNTNGMGQLMKSQTSSLSNKDIKSISIYISKMK